MSLNLKGIANWDPVVQAHSTSNEFGRKEPLRNIHNVKSPNFNIALDEYRGELLNKNNPCYSSHRSYADQLKQKFNNLDRNTYDLRLTDLDTYDLNIIINSADLELKLHLSLIESGVYFRNIIDYIYLPIYNGVNNPYGKITSKYKFKTGKSNASSLEKVVKEYKKAKAEGILNSVKDINEGLNRFAISFKLNDNTQGKEKKKNQMHYYYFTQMLKRALYTWLDTYIQHAINSNMHIYAAYPLQPISDKVRSKKMQITSDSIEFITELLINYTKRERNIKPEVQIYVYEENGKRYIEIRQQSEGSQEKCFNLLCRALESYLQNRSPISGGKTIRRRVRHRQTIKKRTRR